MLWYAYPPPDAPPPLPPAQAQVQEKDEFEEYLTEPEETDLELDLLVWWRAKETKWPALTKMVKQYFSAPASSAGVERVFSAAGKMHSDLQKSAKDSTLENSLFASHSIPISASAVCCVLCRVVRSTVAPHSM